MDKNKFGNLVSRTGIFEGKKNAYKAYVPNNLPRNLSFSIEDLYPLIDEATTSLGEIKNIPKLLQSYMVFSHIFRKKEAVLSSQIEGTQSSLEDFFLSKLKKTETNKEDNIEIMNYLQAMDHGLKSLNDLPLCKRLLCEMHSILLKTGRGSTKTPGQFRKTQNWISGLTPSDAEFVPPPADKLEDCLHDFEKFLNENIKMPILVKIAMAHVQFETIHPFHDGNGRIGRLLITLMLCKHGLLTEPLLYISYYLKLHKDKYYSLLQSVRKKGDWIPWIEFFLKAIIETSKQVNDTSSKIFELFEKDYKKIKEADYETKGLLLVYQSLQKNIFLTYKDASKETGLAYKTIHSSMEKLEKLEIVEEITGNYRNKIFVYRNYINILNKGTIIEKN